MTVQEVIEYLEQHGFIADEVKDMCIEALVQVEQYRALGTVEELKEAREKQPKTDWIPCEERLPSEENEECLVCKKNGVLMVLKWTKKGWNTYKCFNGTYHKSYEIKDVIAWQPIQPYKKEGAE